MEIRGKLEAKFEIQGGNSAKTGMPWSKMSFLLEKAGKVPSKVVLTTFSPKVISFVEDTKIGTELVCGIDVESRSFNGKWFTDVRCFSVETYRSSESVKKTNEQPESSDSIPAPTEFPGDPDPDDLPF